MPFNIFNVIQFGSKGVLNIDDDDLPVGLAFVEKSHDTENLDLLYLTDIANLFANLADIQGVIVTLGFGLCMSLGRIFPGLGEEIRQILVGE